MEYAEYYDGYQHDYQEASMDHNDWIYEEEHNMENQGNYQFQPYNNNLSYWNQDVEYPQDQDYTPFQDQQGPGYFQTRPFIQQDQRNYQGNNYGNQRCYEEEMSNQNIGYTNFNKQGQPRQNTYPPDQASEQDDMKSMMRQIMEGQVRVQAELTERIEMFERKIDSNHREEQAKFEDIYSHLKELENQLAQVASTSTNNEDGVLPEKTEADIEVLKEEDSLHKIHDGETTCLELKEEFNVMEVEEASNGKTSMKRDLSEPNLPRLELKPLPQELRYEFLSSNSTCPVIVNDALSKKKTKTFLVELILDSRWVPPVHAELKKRKMTVINNDRNKLIPTRTITSHKMCLDNRKLNASTRKHHFPWPFTDQKISIFSDLIGNVVKIFLDDFSVYGNAFVSCLSNLCRVLKMCEDTNLFLSWENNHFMVKEGIELEHKISEKSNEVNKEKVEVIVGLKPLTSGREVKSFLGYTNFYRRFIQDSSRVAGPFTQLVCKETTIKKELVTKSIVQAADWSFPFEPGGDFTVKITILEPLTA